MKKDSIGQRMRRLRGEERKQALRELMERFERSGLTASQFSREIGTSATTFGRWRSEVKYYGSGDEQPTFVQLGEEHNEGFELRLESGLCVSVPYGFRADELHRLLQALSS